jgi:hypothetical protein
MKIKSQLYKLHEIERTLKFDIEASYNEVKSDKLSKHHDNILSLIKDLENGI